MSFKVGELSSGPCCEINALIVQVVGEDHPPTQRLAFYEQTNTTRLDAVTASDKPETVNVYFCAKSALHVWNWTGEPKHRLMLEVETEQGQPIKLPLPETRITLRQLDQQWNQIVPILPFVALPGVNSLHDHGTPVLCRAGFIYVFVAGKAWRELEVRVTENGTTYHDIDLDSYRFGGEYVDDRRFATGKALDDIWLPTNWNNQRVDVELCFSEVQLISYRLQRMEDDQALRTRRCQRPELRVSMEATKAFAGKPDGNAMLEAFSTFDMYDVSNQTAAMHAHVTWLNLGRTAFPLSIPAPQRSRQAGFEWMLDQPARYLCDLSGEFLASAFTAAREHVRECEAGTTLYRSKPLEIGAWAQCMEHALDPEARDDEGLWQAQPPATDVLQTARARSLYGVLLRDCQYRLRHLNSRIQDQRHLLELLGSRAQRYPHHGNALLVQQLIVPMKIGGKANPLHHTLDVLKQQGRLDINRFTASSERAQVWRQLQMSQSLMVEHLKSFEVIESLADHLSLDEFEYAAALYFVSQLFVTLAMGPEHYDPLAVSGDIADAVTGASLFTPEASAGQQWISTVINDAGHPLHLMLWPDAELQNLDAPYQPPVDVEQNEGNGHFRASELAKTEQRHPIPEGLPTTLDALFLAALLKRGDPTTAVTVIAKAGAAALITINEGLQGAIEAAERAVQGAQHVASKDPTAKPFTLNEALRRRSLAQLRGMLPEAFGGLQFMSHGEARRRDFYIFGLDDLPQKLPRSAQPYGVYRNQYGPLHISNEGRLSGSSRGVLPPERIVVAIPRNHRTALAVSRVNQRFNAAWQEEMAAQAEDNSRRMGALDKAVKLRDAAQSNRLHRALDSIPVVGAIVGLEIFNLVNELGATEQTTRERSSFRAVAGKIGAAVDLLVALEMITFKAASSHSILAASRRTLFTIPEGAASKLLGSLRDRLLRKISARLIGQLVSGVLFVSINISDAWYSYSWGDDAYIGYLLMAAGGVASTANSVIVGGVVLLGMHPLGWAGLLLIAVGAATVLLLSSKPLEDWLKKGPFGEDSSAVASHLQDPQQAFYYLVSLLADIRINIGNNPEFDPRARSDIWETVPFAVRKVDTCIRIESNLGGLVGGLGELSTKAFLSLETLKVSYHPYIERPRTESSHRHVTPVAYRLWPDALELFVDKPISYQADPERSLPAILHKWHVRAQVHLDDGERVWVFPAPPPKDPTSFGPEYAKPTFEDDKQIFWVAQSEKEGQQ